jgi:hypothetical protein
MSCKGCQPSKFSPEHNRQFKPENNSGCGSKAPNDCDKPSGAIEGSPLWNWEQKHGRLTFNYQNVLGEDGRWAVLYEKSPCPKTTTRKDRQICCSIKYKVIR